jgi:hypothetical protein
MTQYECLHFFFLRPSRFRSSSKGVEGPIQTNPRKTNIYHSSLEGRLRLCWEHVPMKYTTENSFSSKYPRYLGDDIAEKWRGKLFINDFFQDQDCREGGVL